MKYIIVNNNDKNKHDISPRKPMTVAKINAHLIIVAEVIDSLFEKFNNTELSHVKFSVYRGILGDRFSVVPTFRFDKNNILESYDYTRFDDFSNYGKNDNKYRANVVKIVKQLKAINSFIEKLNDENHEAFGYVDHKKNDDLNRVLDFLQHVGELTNKHKINNIINHYQLGNVEQMYRTSKEQKLLDSKISLVVKDIDAENIKKIKI